jgi:hypothetical protein
MAYPWVRATGILVPLNAEGGPSDLGDIRDDPLRPLRHIVRRCDCPAEAAFECDAGGVEQLLQPRCDVASSMSTFSPSRDIIARNACKARDSR